MRIILMLVFLGASIQSFGAEHGPGGSILQADEKPAPPVEIIVNQTHNRLSKMCLRKASKVDPTHLSTTPLVYTECMSEQYQKIVERLKGDPVEAF